MDTQSQPEKTKAKDEHQKDRPQPNVNEWGPAPGSMYLGDDVYIDADDLGYDPDPGLWGFKE
jgi:hypothetical protein